MKETRHLFDDPHSPLSPGMILDSSLSRLKTSWMRWFYPFSSLGEGFWAHHSCDIRRCIAPYIRLGDEVKLDRQVWLTIPFVPKSADPVIVIDDGCQIGRRCMISAQNRIHIERNTVFGPQALVMDHNHEFEDVTVPIGLQGTTDGGTIRIEEGCWIGFGAAIVCGKGELVIGRNSVVGANSVVTRSIPPHSVASGNPARVVKSFEAEKGVCVLGSSRTEQGTAK
jgi:acetyltransferase-like isoleucine patch superfamily enzyme